MSKTLLILAALVLLALPATAEQAPSETTEANVSIIEQAPETTVEDIQEVKKAKQASQLFTSWSPCSDYQGNPCVSPGEVCKCEWVPGEPGFCTCSSSYTWTCW